MRLLYEFTLVSEIGLLVKTACNFIVLNIHLTVKTFRNSPTFTTIVAIQSMPHCDDSSNRAYKSRVWLFQRKLFLNLLTSRKLSECYYFDQAKILKQTLKGSQSLSWLQRLIATRILPKLQGLSLKVVSIFTYCKSTMEKAVSGTEQAKCLLAKFAWAQNIDRRSLGRSSN